MFKVLIVGLCLFSVLMLAGCGGGGGGSAFGGSDFANLPGGGGGGDIIIPQGHNPEPTTLMLLGIGLSGLVVQQARKRRKH